MDKILGGWALRDIQTYLNIRLQLEQYGKNDEDVRQYVKDCSRRRITSVSLGLTMPHCPKCDVRMTLEPINSDPYGRDKIGNPVHKSWWRCPNDQTVIYNTKTMQEIIEKGVSYATR